jgi:hypothetical protein
MINRTTMRFRRTVSSRLLALVIGAVGVSVLAAGAAEESAWTALQKKYLRASRAEHDAPIKAWSPIATWNFDDGKLPEGFHVYEGEWKVDAGKLVAHAGKPDDNRVIKIANCEWPAFRLEFDATLRPEAGRAPTQIGDIGIRFNADAETGAFTDGYCVITAQYGNQATVFYRLNIPHSRTEWSPIEPGKTHRVVLEVVKPHVRLWVDSRVILDAWERRGTSAVDHGDFLPMDPKRVIALHTYDTRMEIDNLTISVPAK